MKKSPQGSQKMHRNALWVPEKSLQGYLKMPSPMFDSVSQLNQTDELVAQDWQVQSDTTQSE